MKKSESVYCCFFVQCVKTALVITAFIAVIYAIIDDNNKWVRNCELSKTECELKMFIILPYNYMTIHNIYQMDKIPTSLNSEIHWVMFPKRGRDGYPTNETYLLTNQQISNLKFKSMSKDSNVTCYWDGRFVQPVAECN